MAYIKGSERNQVVLFPEAIDDYVEEDNLVRFIDVFVDGLNIEELGFERSAPEETGRPGYDPRDLLKLYIYGYVNKIRSSRRLERESHRNVELMWLMRRLKPDFKTVADFRKDNREAFRRVFHQFNRVCHELDLFGKKLVAVDGSKFKAVNNRDRNFTTKKLERAIQRSDDRVKKYLASLNHMDKREESKDNPTAEELKEKIKKLRSRKGQYRRLLRELENKEDKQISLTDPDSRAMPKSPKVDVGYNVQTVVDEKNKLIVEQDVTNEVNDLNQLSKMAIQAKQALGVDKLKVVADKGYYHGAEVRKCHNEGITCYIEKANTSANTKLGLFGKELFRYVAKKDCYVCPAKEKLPFHFETVEKKRRIRYYWTTACTGCELRARCTRNKEYRRITRWEDESLLEEMKKRVDANPKIIRLRKQIVEHPFGTMKHWSDESSFLMKGLVKVRAEFSLTALAYNMKRVANLVGVPKMIEALG